MFTKAHGCLKDFIQFGNQSNTILRLRLDSTTSMSNLVVKLIMLKDGQIKRDMEKIDAIPTGFWGKSNAFSGPIAY